MKYCYIQNQKCWICKKVKDRKEFYKDSSTKYGIQKACKDCQKERNNKYNREHKTYFQKKGKEYYKKENNTVRYRKYRKIYLFRRKKYSQSVLGRFNTLLCSARGRAKKQKRPYQLSIKWLFEQFDKQNGRCKLTNIKLEFKTNVHRKRKFLPFSPSLHRDNEHKGYTKDNTMLVCTGINIALNRFKKKDFNKIINGYLKEQRKQHIIKQ